MSKFIPSMEALKKRFLAFLWQVGWFVVAGLSAVALNALTSGEIKLPMAAVAVIAAGLTQLSKHANNILNGKQ